jgi:Gas vesicle protein
VSNPSSLPERRFESASALGAGRGPAQLADVLERVLDKGIVVAGDIQVNLLDIELLTIRIRLLIASADKAREMGIDWWEGDPFLSRGSRDQRTLDDRLRRLEAATGLESEEAEGEEERSRG